MASENRHWLRRYLELITARKGGVESGAADLEGLAQASMEAAEGPFDAF